MIRDVSQLEIYQESLSLVGEIYALVRKLPKSEYDIINQIQRSAKSISANIAEGFAKQRYPKEFKRYLLIALGSSDETISHLRTLYITCQKNREVITMLAMKYKVLSKRINKLNSIWLTD